MPREIYKARYRDGIDQGIDLVAATRCRVKKVRYVMSLKTMKEVIRETGTTENALRYYNAKGVLPPTVQETGGRRQWLYDDAAVQKLKMLFLLKYLGLSVEEAGEVLRNGGPENEDQRSETSIGGDCCRQVLMQRLEQLRDERGLLDQKIFIAQVLAVAYGEDLFDAGGEAPDFSAEGARASVLNEMVRKLIFERVGRKGDAK